MIANKKIRAITMTEPKCGICSGKKYLLSTRDDNRKAVEACDNCRTGEFNDEDAAKLAKLDGVDCCDIYPCYVKENVENGTDDDDGLKNCPHCGDDLTIEHSVIRDYLQKGSIGEGSGIEDVSAYGHYEDGCFVSDSFEGFGDGNYDLADDSDKCDSCNGQL
jgi:hypothetical protein